MDKQHYMNKCYQHTNNGPYKHLKKDPTETLKREARNILLDLKKTGYINEQTYYQLKPTDSPPPRFHGLPKIHKQGVPIRPVVSCTGMPLYKLSKFVASILSKYTSSDHCKNSTEFSEYIKHVRIEEDEFMFSFDVTSLYTNVTINDTLSTIEDLLKNDSNFSNKTNIPVKNFLDLVTLVLTKTWYLFDGSFYSQINGVAMGSPASSVVAEIYMQARETTAITTSSNPQKIWKRYVDDGWKHCTRSESIWSLKIISRFLFCKWLIVYITVTISTNLTEICFNCTNENHTTVL